MKYLNESIDRYISEFCERQNTEDRYLKADLAAEVRAARKVDYQGLSPCLATQVFLCFSICLLI